VYRRQIGLISPCAWCPTEGCGCSLLSSHRRPPSDLVLSQLTPVSAGITRVSCHPESSLHVLWALPPLCSVAPQPAVL